MPKIKLYFIQASRCIRTAWQLEELGLDYEVVFGNSAYEAKVLQFYKEAGGPGKFPVLEDHGVKYFESGNICQYLCDRYDTKNRLLAPVGSSERYKTLQWVHASEGTYLVHSLAILYARWHQSSGDVSKTEEGLSVDVVKDMDYLEQELGKTGMRFLRRSELTVADIMMHFSVGNTIVRELGTKGRRWPRIERWYRECEARPAYKRAVEKTGYVLLKNLFG